MKTLQHLCALAALVLAGCSTTSPDVIKRDDAQRMSNVLDGVVISTRPVTVEGSQSGVGAAAGGVVGGVAGRPAELAAGVGALGQVVFDHVPHEIAAGGRSGGARGVAAAFGGVFTDGRGGHRSILGRDPCRKRFATFFTR